MYRAFGATILVALMTFPGSPRVLAQAGSAPAPAKAPSDLDALMAQVLARRAADKILLSQYVLDETESFEMLGPARTPLHRMKREFTWYARDGIHVRSPVRFDGVTVDETARRQYEDEWIKREQARQARRERHEPEKNELTIGADGLQVSGGNGGAEPRFVSEAYFMDFKFEPGNYYLAGREKLEGHDVLRIEYYPTHLFNDTDDEKTPREIKKKSEDKKDREERGEQDIDRKMNKTALVTLWVDQAEHQIVKSHVRERLARLPPGRMARPRRRAPRLDDDGPAIRGRMAPSHHQYPRGFHPRHRLIRGQLRARLHQLPRGRRQDDDQGAEIGGVVTSARGATGPRCRSARVPGCQTRDNAKDARGARRAAGQLVERWRRGAGAWTVRRSGARGRDDSRDPRPRECVIDRRSGAETRGRGSRRSGDTIGGKGYRTAPEGHRPLRIRRRPQALPVARRSDRRRHRPRRARASGHGGDGRRRRTTTGMAPVHEPADVPADPRLRRWLRADVWRTREHGQPDGSRGTLVGPPHLGRHQAGSARTGAYVQERPAHARIHELRHLES